MAINCQCDSPLLNWYLHLPASENRILKVQKSCSPLRMSTFSYEDPHICKIPYLEFANHQSKGRFWGLQQGHVCLSSFNSLWNWTKLYNSSKRNCQLNKPLWQHKCCSLTGFGTKGNNSNGSSLPQQGSSWVVCWWHRRLHAQGISEMYLDVDFVRDRKTILHDF